MDDIPLLRAGTLEALLERIEPVEETRRRPPRALRRMRPLPTRRQSRPHLRRKSPFWGPAQLAAFLPRWTPSLPEPRPDPAIDLAAFLVVAQGQGCSAWCKNAAPRAPRASAGFVAAADELGHNASEAGVSAMASLAAALASALTRPLSPQAVLELATDTVAVLSVMVSQGQRQSRSSLPRTWWRRWKPLTAKPPVRKAL